jgi:hypothetical protein
MFAVEMIAFEIFAMPILRPVLGLLGRGIMAGGRFLFAGAGRLVGWGIPRFLLSLARIGNALGGARFGPMVFRWLVGAVRSLPARALFGLVDLLLWPIRRFVLPRIWAYFARTIQIGKHFLNENLGGGILGEWSGRVIRLDLAAIWRYAMGSLGQGLSRFVWMGRTFWHESIHRFLERIIPRHVWEVSPLARVLQELGAYLGETGSLRFAVQRALQSVPIGQLGRFESELWGTTVVGIGGALSVGTAGTIWWFFGGGDEVEEDG